MAGVRESFEQNKMRADREKQIASGQKAQGAVDARTADISQQEANLQLDIRQQQLDKRRDIFNEGGWDMSAPMPNQPGVGFTASMSDVGAGAGGYNTDQLINDVRNQTNEVYGTIKDAMAQITGIANSSSIDTDTLVGQLESGFNSTKSMIMDSAMASAAKAAYEMDAYLGSHGSDARSAVRRQMSASVTSNILNQTQQNIANLYMGHVNQVIDTTLKGSEINANIKIGAAKALGDLAGKAGDLLLGTNSAIMGMYAQDLDYAVKLMDAHTRRQALESEERMFDKKMAMGYDEMSLKSDLAQLQADTARTTSSVWQYNRRQDAPDSSFDPATNFTDTYSGGGNRGRANKRQASWFYNV